MAVLTAKAVFLLDMIGDTTPEWIPNDDPSGVQVAFINDVGQRDGWQSVLQPVPYTHTTMAVVFTSAVNMTKLKADVSGRWQWVEDVAPEVAI